MARKSCVHNPSPLTTSLLLCIMHNYPAQVLLGWQLPEVRVQHRCSVSSSLPTLSQDHPRKKHHHKQAVQWEFLSPSHDILFPKGYLDPGREQAVIQSNCSEAAASGCYPSWGTLSPGLPSTGCAHLNVRWAARPWQETTPGEQAAAVRHSQPVWNLPWLGCRDSGKSSAPSHSTWMTCASKLSKVYGHRLNTSDLSTLQDSTLPRIVYWNKRLFTGFLITWEEF